MCRQPSLVRQELKCDISDSLMYIRRLLGMVPLMKGIKTKEPGVMIQRWVERYGHVFRFKAGMGVCTPQSFPRRDRGFLNAPPLVGGHSTDAGHESNQPCPHSLARLPEAGHCKVQPEPDFGQGCELRMFSS